MGWTAAVAGGTPILRQDWPTPYLSFVAALGKISGWDPSGIGGTTGPSSSFALVPLLAILASAIGPRIAETFFVFAVALLCALNAQSCVRAFSTSLVAQIAAPVFVLFNPWVYTKLIAGHMFMLLSYGGLMLFVREALDERGSQLRMMLCGLLIGPQTQFFVLSFAPAMYLATVRRQRLAILTWVLLALPELVAVLVNHSALLGTPLTLSWEDSQSIDPSQAPLLTGYFTHYAATYAGLPLFGMWAIVALVVLACLLIVSSDRRRLFLPLLTIAAVVAAFGTRAPWGALVQWAFENVPEVGLFRELFDFLGIAAVGYLVLCSYAARRVRGASVVWLVAATILTVPWVLSPPQAFWVRAEDVPKTIVPNAANTRFALIPAFQPMSFRGMGAGIDPDLYPRPRNLTPINENFPLYPIGPALASYLRSGNTRGLAALSVSCIVARPWLDTDRGALEGQSALPYDARTNSHETRPSKCIDGLPELTVSAIPRIGTLDTNIGAGNVFFSDAREAGGAGVPDAWHRFGGVISVRATNLLVDARQGWVDARLAFTNDPELSQEFGGALTVDRYAELDIRPGIDALVLARGALYGASGRLLARNTGGYRWIHVPSDVASVRCFGLCVVALQGSPPPLALNPPTQRAYGVNFRAYTPWLVRATLPAGPPQLLRYNVAYNELWMARIDGDPLPHVRIDGIVNGWLLPVLHRPRAIYLVEVGAFSVACAEAMSLVGLIWVFIAFFATSRARERSLQADLRPNR